MKENYTHIVALLDRSGSMQKVANDTIGGFNTFIEEQKKVPGEATLTLIQFSDNYEITLQNTPLQHIAPLNTQTYKPSGWTALNDALARAVNETGTWLAAKPENERPSKVLVLVMTDGEENRSRDYIGKAGQDKLKTLVSHQKNKYSWTFCFIGANIDAFATAETLGISRGDTISYSQAGFGQTNAFKSVSRGVAAARMSEKLEKFFTNEIDQERVSSSVLDFSNIVDTINKYTKDEKPND